MAMSIDGDRTPCFFVLLGNMCDMSVDTGLLFRAREGL